MSTVITVSTQEPPSDLSDPFPAHLPSLTYSNASPIAALKLPKNVPASGPLHWLPLPGPLLLQVTTRLAPLPQVKVHTAIFLSRIDNHQTHYTCYLFILFVIWLHL